MQSSVKSSNEKAVSVKNGKITAKRKGKPKEMKNNFHDNIMKKSK